MNEIIPAILVSEEDSFFDRVREIKDAAKVIQIDVLDGFFTANESWYRPSALLDAPEQVFELHLMVEDPGKFVREALDLANVGRIIWHIETEVDHLELVSLCQNAGKEAGLAISPETSIDRLEAFAEEIDEVLVLGVTPGASGQKLKPESIEKVREIRQRWPKLKIAFDGGIEEGNIAELKAAGVDRFCAASAVFGAKDPVKALQRLEKL